MANDYVANLRNNAVRMGFLNLCLEDFATRLVADGIHRGPLTEASIAAIRAQCILGLKNSHAAGLSIDDEATILRQAVDELEKLLDAIIAKGREDVNR